MTKKNPHPFHIGRGRKSLNNLSLSLIYLDTLIRNNMPKNYSFLYHKNYTSPNSKVSWLLHIYRALKQNLRNTYKSGSIDWEVIHEDLHVQHKLEKDGKHTPSEGSGDIA